MFRSAGLRADSFFVKTSAELKAHGGIPILTARKFLDAVEQTPE